MKLKDLYKDIYSWQPFFDEVFEDRELYNSIEDLLNNSNKVVFPEKKAIFNFLKFTSLQDVLVVIIGQDPYFNYNQATGLSFSVPKTLADIPSSLQNIYKNLLNYGHFYKMPTHGNLEYWAYQGCLMLNTALTVEHKKPNSHSKIWAKFTDKLISYISEHKKHVCFVLWGKPALDKNSIIDKDKHKLIISSHPSGLSCNNTLGFNPAFNNQNHFKKINKYLKKHKKPELVWQII